MSKIIVILILFLLVFSCQKNKDQLIINGSPYIIKGVNYNPIPKCKDHRSLNFNFIKDDIKDLKELNINTIRIYNHLSDIDNAHLSYEHLDILEKNNIKVIINIGLSQKHDLLDAPKKFKNHPAILFYMIGNEIVVNAFYTKEIEANNKEPMSTTEIVVNAKKMIKKLRKHTGRPIAVSYGKFRNTTSDLLLLTGENDSDNDPSNDADIIAYQKYNPKKLKRILKEHHKISKKPFFFSEYGVDAFNHKTQKVDEEIQSKHNYNLTKLILDHTKEGNGLGGVIFEFSDEWWKAKKRGNCTQESLSIPFENQNYPDNNLNEEYWGLVDMERNKRKTYYSLQKLFNKY